MGDPRLSIEERYASKDQYLELVKQAAQELVGQRYLLEEDVEVRQFGDTAVVTGHGKFHVGDNKFEARFIDVYAKRNDAWQMVAWQSTRLPD